MTRVRNTPEDAWRFIERGGPNECWPWRGGCDHDGYGLISISGKMYRAHRVILHLATGQDPGSFLVCHTCDNPPCCNPTHLYAGTHSDNTLDAIRRGRWVGPTIRGSRHPRAKLTETTVAEIRHRRADGETGLMLAREFGVATSTICELTKHPTENWSHV